MEEGLLVVCQLPVLLKDGAELTTEQQRSIMQQFHVKCTTRPLRHGRAGVHSTEDTREWRELSCHGPVGKVEAALEEAKRLCEETRLQRTVETPDEQRQRLEAKNDKTSNMISAEEARKEANIKAHKERSQKNKKYIYI